MTSQLRAPLRTLGVWSLQQLHQVRRACVFVAGAATTATARERHRTDRAKRHQTTPPKGLVQARTAPRKGRSRASVASPPQGCASASASILGNTGEPSPVTGSHPLAAGKPSVLQPCSGGVVVVARRRESCVKQGGRHEIGGRVAFGETPELLRPSRPPLPVTCEVPSRPHYITTPARPRTHRIVALRDVVEHLRVGVQ